MDKELRIALTKYFIIVALTILYVAIMINIVGPWISQVAFGQETKAPAPITPTPVPTPTPTSPNPNLQYLPQKAYVQAYAPENGIPSTSGALQVVPTVVPTPPVQQSSGLGIPGLDIAAILALGGTALTYFKTHLVSKKADRNEEISREQSAQIVKGAEVDRKLADQVYENMPDKGESINDKPEIQLRVLNDNVDEAVKTATKA